MKKMMRKYLIGMVSLFCAVAMLACSDDAEPKTDDPNVDRTAFAPLHEICGTGIWVADSFVCYDAEGNVIDNPVGRWVGQFYGMIFSLTEEDYMEYSLDESTGIDRWLVSRHAYVFDRTDGSLYLDGSAMRYAQVSEVGEDRVTLTAFYDEFADPSKYETENGHDFTGSYAVIVMRPATLAETEELQGSAEQ